MAKKNQISAQDLLKQMYPDLQTSDDYVEDKAADPKSPEAQILELQTQIAQLNGRLEGGGERQSRSRDIGQLPQAPVRPIMDMAAAPDPIQKPGEYAKWLSEQTQAQIQYEKDAWQWQNSVAATANNRANSLWDDFRTSNKAYASDEERVEIAASRVLAKQKAAGINIDKYMYEDSERFMKDVTGEFDKLFGKPKDADSDDDDDGDDDRSEFQSQGAPAGRDGPAAVRQRPQQFGALGTAVNDWQAKTGFRP